MPFIRFLLYYAVLIAVALALAALVPGANRALVAPISIAAAGEGGLFGAGGTGVLPPPPWTGPAGRGVLALLVALGALALALPVAWVYTFTRRLRSDASLVHAVVILPIVVAGIVLVVKNSLALAFALAGIVAGVRFRQKLNEPKDAVYILLALGIGLAAGVHALDVALVTSLTFNLVVLLLWRYDIGPTTGGEPALMTGDVSLLSGRTAEEAERLRERALAQADGIAPDGMLIVHAVDVDAARRGVEIALGAVATTWRLTEPEREAGGTARFEAVLQLKKKANPVALLSELEERWFRQVAAAQYIPLHGSS